MARATKKPAFDLRSNEQIRGESRDTGNRDEAETPEMNELESLITEVNGIQKSMTQEDLAAFWAEQGHPELNTKKDAYDHVDGLTNKTLLNIIKDELTETVIENGKADKEDGEGGEEEGEGDNEGSEGDGDEDSDAKDGEDDDSDSDDGDEGDSEDGEGEGDEDGDDEDSDDSEEEGEGESEDGEESEGEGDGEDGDDSDSENEGGNDSDEENESNNPDDDLLHRVVALEKWRAEKVDPILGGEMPAPKELKAPKAPKDAAKAPVNEIQPAPKGDDLGWLPTEDLLKLLDGDDRKEDVKLEDNGDILPEWFPKALQLVKGRKPMFWQGPSGCGKTHTAGMLAKYLGLPFGAHSCSEGMHIGDLAGMLLPVEAGGNFVMVPSLFISMCQKPGIFLWDELDAADSNFLVAFNMMTAQRELYIPSRHLATLPEFEIDDILAYWSKHFGVAACQELIERDTIKSLRDLRVMLGAERYAKLDDSFTLVKLHPDFTIIAAANTFGHGASAVYAGRNQLDGATLDRFRIGMMKLDYSEKVESAILSKDAYRWGKYLRASLAKLNMVRRLVTTRFLKDCSDMQKNFDWSESEWSEQFFNDFPEVDVIKVKSTMKDMIVADIQARRGGN